MTACVVPDLKRCKKISPELDRDGMSSSGLISGLAPDLKQVRIYVVPSQTSPDLHHSSLLLIVFHTVLFTVSSS